MRGALKETAAMAVAEGAAARSQVATPVPLADPQMLQQQISQLVRQGHYNTAFQQVFSILFAALLPAGQFFLGSL